MTRLICARHLLYTGDAGQRHVTFVRVIIGRFLHPSNHSSYLLARMSLKSMVTSSLAYFLGGEHEDEQPANNIKSVFFLLFIIVIGMRAQLFHKYYRIIWINHDEVYFSYLDIPIGLACLRGCLGGFLPKQLHQ